VVVPVVRLANRSALRDQLATAHPDFGAAEVDRSATVALAGAAVFRAVLLALCALLVWKLATALPWTRRLTTLDTLTTFKLP
jgi:hypothetical protein